MLRYQLDIDAPPGWAPLELIATVTAADPRVPTVDPSRFMHIGRVRCSGRSSVHLYKHIDTRHYLNLDGEGRAYETLDWSLADRPEDITVVCQPAPTLGGAVEWACVIEATAHRWRPLPTEDVEA